MLKQRNRMPVLLSSIGSSHLTKLNQYLLSLSIALVGLVIRLAIGIEGIHGTDILFHIEGVKSILLSGSPYCSANYNYPPLYAYLQLIGIAIAGWTPLGYKLMAISFDVILSIFIYAILNNLGVEEKRSLIVQALWCFNPLAIVASSWYGLFDSIPTLLSILSLLLIIKRRSIASALTLSLGILTKFFPIIFLPMNIFVLLAKGGKKKDLSIYLATVFFILIFVELLATFRCLDDAIEDQFLFHLERVDKGLSLIPWYPYSSLLSTIIAIAVTLALLLGIRSSNFNDSYTYLVSAIASIALVIVNPFIYPHYVIWSLPLTLIALTLFINDKAKVFKLNLLLMLIFSAIGLGYWKFYKIYLVTVILRYIFNLSLLAVLIILITLYLRSLKQSLRSIFV